MRASNTEASAPDAPAELTAAQLRAFADGSAGFVVRCTPRRWTVLADLGAAGVVFAKIRQGRNADAAAEWRWLRELPQLGVQVPRTAGFLCTGRTTVVATWAVPGRGLDAWLRAALDAGRLQAAVAFACRVVAPRVRALHDRGLACRDLYWNHWFAVGLDADTATLLDVERVFRPRWRFERWRVKDLAGLASSFPGPVPTRAALRFLRAYFADLPAGRERARRLHRLFRRARSKAARIRAHVPRYG